MCIKRSNHDMKQIKCIASDCIAWDEIDSRIERENHSGAYDILSAEACKRKPYQSIKKRRTQWMYWNTNT